MPDGKNNWIRINERVKDFFAISLCRIYNELVRGLL